MPEAYPLLRELVQQLAELDESDMQLPLGVLVNLNRRPLRFPLAGLLDIGPNPATVGANAAMKRIDKELVRRYPVLNLGGIYARNAQLEELYVDPEIDASRSAKTDLFDAERVGDSGLLKLLHARVKEDWQSYETVFLLHQLTWSNAMFQTLAPMLEMELNLHYQIPWHLRQLAEQVRNPQTTLPSYVLALMG